MSEWGGTVAGMNDNDLQANAAGVAYDTWDPVDEFGPGRAIETYEEAQRAAFMDGHAAGWRDRARRDAEPPDGAVVLLYRPEDAERTLVYRRRDEWAELGSPANLSAGLRWYILGMPGDYQAPVSWHDLLADGTVTELIEGDTTWPST